MMMLYQPGGLNWPIAANSGKGVQATLSVNAAQCSDEVDIPSRSRTLSIANVENICLPPHSILGRHEYSVG